MTDDCAAPTTVTPSPTKHDIHAALSATELLEAVIIGLDTHRIRRQRLVELAEALGIDRGETAAALEALVAAGEIAVENGRVRPGSRLARWQRHLTQHQVDPRLPWNGRWSVVVLDDGDDRAGIATELRRLHFGRWRDGVWMRPDNLGLRRPDQLRRSGTTWSAESVAPLDGRTIAERLWDLDAWAARASGLLAAFEDSRSLPARFRLGVAGAVVVFDDPLLPDGLCPPGWPAAAFRKEFTVFGTELRYELLQQSQG